MPYSGASDKSLPSNVKGMSAKKKKVWVATFNSVYNTCISDGGDKSSCEGKAFKIANGNAKKKSMQMRAWSGAASNYASTEAYCSACLIDVNGSGAKTQENCKLPVKAAGSSSYDKDGIHAAAVRFGSIKKPSGVSESKWSSAVKSAANKLISAYSSFDEVAPDSVYEAAGKTLPKKKQTVEQKSLLRKAWKGVMDVIFGPEIELPVVERSIALDRVYEQIWSSLDQMTMDGGKWAYPLNMYIGDDGSSLFSLITQDGKIYQVPIQISQDTVTLGDWTQVMETFQPVTQSRFTIRRQGNGSYRWFGLVGTSVINRVGEIDSTKLFDSFVEKIEKTGNYPTLDFYHMGDSDPKTWDFGIADYVARDGCCYIASGTFYENHPLAKAAIRVMGGDSQDEWGHSIEFYADAEPESLKIQPNIQIPIFNDGENTRISMVLEKDAAGLFTRMLNVSQKEERSMNKKVEEALGKLFGDDEEAKLAFIESVDTVNRTVKDEKLIHRDKKEDPVEKDDPDQDSEDADEEDTVLDDTDVADEPEETTERSIELDEDGMKILVQQVSQSKDFTALVQPFQQAIADLQALAGELKSTNDAQAKDIARLRKTNEKLIERVNTLSVDESDKKKTWQQDLPARKVTQATYRPSIANQDNDEDDEDYKEDLTVRANRTLSALPKY